MRTASDDVTYSIVVPVYNSERTLPRLYERLVAVMEGLGEPFEMVFVEDCGTDGSWKILRALAEQDERVWAVQLLRNFGQANATMCGLTHARGRSLITLDDDLQHPPEEIPVLIEALRTNPDLDVVVGIPDEKRHAYWRRVGSDVVNAINSFSLKKPRSLRLSGFRAMRRLVAEQLVERNVPKPALGALLYSTTPRIANVSVRHEAREAGQSGYTLPKILSLTLSNFLAFSDFPLRFMALAGAVGIVISLAVGIRIVVRYLQVGVVVPGWLTLALLLVGISGFNFFAFGLIGEYLLRVLQSVQHTPQYIVRQKVPAAQREDASNNAPD